MQVGINKITCNCCVFLQIVQVDWFNLALIWSVSLQIHPSSLVWVMVRWSNELGDFQNSPSSHLQKWYQILVLVYCAVQSSIFSVPIDSQNASTTVRDTSPKEIKEIYHSIIIIREWPHCYSLFIGIFNQEGAMDWTPTFLSMNSD